MRGKTVTRIGILSSLVLFCGLGLVPETSVNAFRVEDRRPASEDPVAEPMDENDLSQDDLAIASENRARALFPRGDERWLFRFERKVAADFQGRNWLSLKIGGRVALESAGQHGANRFYLFTFEADRLEMQGANRASPQKLPSVRAEIDASGNLRELRFVSSANGATISDETKDIVKDLLGQWFFFTNESRLGAAESKFGVLKSSGGEKGGEEIYTKRVLHYVSHPEITRLDSTHEWAAAKDGGTSRVGRIEGIENFTIGGSSGDFDQRTSYRWVWIGTEKISRFADFEVDEAFRVADASPGSPEEARSRTRVSRVDFRAVWPRLGALASAERLGFFERVRKTLESGDGTLVADIVAGVKGRATLSLEWRTGVGLLAGTSNEVAQQALLELYRESRGGTEAKLSILAGVAAGEGRPAGEWKEVLSNELRGDAAIRDASLFALGSAIRKETDAMRRRDLESVLWREISDATSAEARSTVLEAIGNSASSEFYSYLRTQAEATEPRVRAKAIGATRFLASDLAKPLIDVGLADPAPVVRQAAEWSRRFVEASAAE